MSDPVSHPSHYTAHPSGVEPIALTRHESFLRGNILKYVMRAPYKGRELEDMRKARQYLDWEIERLESNQVQIQAVTDPSMEETVRIVADRVREFHEENRRRRGKRG